MTETTTPATLPTIAQQEEWAKEDGFNLWSIRCFKCHLEILEGNDCPDGHYTEWLAARIEANRKIDVPFSGRYNIAEALEVVKAYDAAIPAAEKAVHAAEKATGYWEAAMEPLVHAIDELRVGRSRFAEALETQAGIDIYVLDQIRRAFGSKAGDVVVKMSDAGWRVDPSDIRSRTVGLTRSVGEVLEVASIRPGIETVTTYDRNDFAGTHTFDQILDGEV